MGAMTSTGGVEATVEETAVEDSDSTKVDIVNESISGQKNSVETETRGTFRTRLTAGFENRLSSATTLRLLTSGRAATEFARNLAVGSGDARIAGFPRKPKSERRWNK